MAATSKGPSQVRVPRPDSRGIPEILTSRILVFFWSFGALLKNDLIFKLWMAAATAEVRLGKLVRFRKAVSQPPALRPTQATWSKLLTQRLVAL